MNPLSFITLFTVGELVMMGLIALVFSGGPAQLWNELASAKEVLFWLIAGGFIWVIGDLFQQYAVKYAGITRGIPLSNTNQLWGLLWGVMVFGELRDRHASLTQVVIGSLTMAAGALVISLSSVSESEHASWREAAHAQGERYGVDPEWTRARLAGDHQGSKHRRTVADWVIVSAATAVIVFFATMARKPQIAVSWEWVGILALLLVFTLCGAGLALWRTTRFS
jgi:hypothetical protein